MRREECLGGSRDSTRAVTEGRASPEPGAKGWVSPRVQSRAGLGCRPIRGKAIAWPGLAWPEVWPDLDWRGRAAPGHAAL